MVRNQLQIAVRVAPYQRVQAILGGLVPGIEFLAGNVGRVEIRAQRLFTRTFHEGLLIGQPVPGPVVDRRKALLPGIIDASEPLFPVIAVRLTPEQIVHDV